MKKLFLLIILTFFCVSCASQEGAIKQEPQQPQETAQPQDVPAVEEDIPPPVMASEPDQGYVSGDAPPVPAGPTMGGDIPIPEVEDDEDVAPPPMLDSFVVSSPEESSGPPMPISGGGQSGSADHGDQGAMPGEERVAAIPREQRPGIVEGVLQFQDVSGEIIKGSGLPVYLYQDLPNVRPYVEGLQYYDGRQKKPTEDILAARRQAYCDEEGRFVFRDIPPGRWIFVGQYFLKESRKTLVGPAFLQDIVVKGGSGINVTITGPINKRLLAPMD